MPRRGKKLKAPLSEEEKVLLLQQQLLAEEERVKKREDLLSQFLKDKLAKEEHHSALNLNKINTQWRSVLREVKATELRKDIEILCQTFERVVDCKDSVIKSLAQDLSEAEEQYAHALRSHLHNIDQLLDLQRHRLAYLEESYASELEALSREFDRERKMIIDHHEKESRYLQDVFLAMEQTFTDTEYEGKLEFQSMRDDLKNKNVEEKHYLRMQLENVVEDLWRRFQQALKSYTDATEDRKMAFEALKVKDEKSSREIDMQMKKLQKLQDSIAILKNKIAVHTRECEEQNRHIREDKDMVLRQLRRLKSQMNQARAKGRNSLAKLTLESSAALQALRKLVAKGDLILRLAELCRKLETEEEKVLPFYTTQLNAEEQEEVEQEVWEQPSLELTKLMEDYSGLERFWQRYNKVKLEQLSLAQRREELLVANGQLREVLRCYLNGISVNEDVLRHENSLLIIRGPRRPPAPAPRPAPAPEPVHNVIEAAHIASRIL
ncbi:dynein regulatory complex subunit 2 [Tachyglossus aculeatus]|uniref:dynein regulatory complex subunit 2 n=1 Tax=Tachyglossus aculeatus TaxID=9261 RepID=UPI0018F776D0|nr:dynein regulatory complex subunit 2 [Tachyglossus aculeatus]